MKAREAIDGIGRMLLDRVEEGLTGTLLIRVEYSQGGIRSVKAASEPEYDEVRADGIRLGNLYEIASVSPRNDDRI